MNPLLPIVAVIICGCVIYINKDYIKSLLQGLRLDNKSDTLDQQIKNKTTEKLNKDKLNDLNEDKIDD